MRENGGCGEKDGGGGEGGGESKLFFMFTSM